MAWARLDDGFHDHHKVEGLSLASVGLFTLCLTWANKVHRKADVPGLIPTTRVRKHAGNLAVKLSDELVKARLWETVPDGFMIHNFKEYLPKQRDPDEASETARKAAEKRWRNHA